MSIDLTREAAIAVTDIPGLPWLPRRRGGKPWHVATIYRWMKDGVGGRRLEYVRVGGTRFTTASALMRFFGGCAAPDGGPRIESDTNEVLAAGV
jgi:hypothetical protein